MRRPTIADIARRAGVSQAAVSFALNGRPGVSAATRDRILAAADALGWQPNTAARSLSAAAAGAVGLAVARPARTLGVEPFFMQLISGIQGELSERGYALLLDLVEDVHAEASVHRRWWAERRVDGVLLVDLRTGDPRPRVLREIGMPAVLAGGPDPTGAVPGVWVDDARAMTAVVEHLHGLGHEHLAHVSGPPGMAHSAHRAEAFTAAAGPRAARAATDFSDAEGAVATRGLLRRRPRPTAVVYDNDVMAVAGLSAARQAGLAVPGDLSVVAWEDSALCRLTHPTLTALSRDPFRFGAAAAARLLDLVRRGPGGGGAGDTEFELPELVVRESTAPPRPNGG
ncbi:LacI family DNA-binding transcriptional regulator [Nocardiopsis sp. RSe5-2]|uniref:LacI family DNA-binding transcriptional regulator n=1 Tax=Nocardiopsis endophytica TaxID=3018445 RepID=A0ABT4U3J7_9ACTN|nr:LacI family DNA-binding transcriptional regulator [Nocardiopsis endophytica]MDA2811537.1 LacI family DNA-binding transcriptional regulator [Nocardiopsis endophytica]